MEINDLTDLPDLADFPDFTDDAPGFASPTAARRLMVDTLTVDCPMTRCLTVARRAGLWQALLERLAATLAWEFPRR